GFRTYFTPEGIRVVPRLESGSSWRWGLTLVGYGQGERIGSAVKATLSPSGHRVEYRRGALDERYENTPAGLEQVFILPAPSKHTTGSEQLRSRDLVHIDLALWGDLSPKISEDMQAIDFVTSAGTPALRYGQLKVTDARGESLPAWMEGFAHG